MVTSSPERRRALTFGIIGAGVAIAVIVGVLFVMPLLTRPATMPPAAVQPSSSPSSPPPQEVQNDPERQRILDTPNTGQLGQPIIPHQELRAQDPIFDRYMLVQEECLNNLQNNVDPNVPGCRQAFEDGMERWCSISSAEYNQVKCKEVSDKASLFELDLEFRQATRGLNLS
jgi:hypothetical protein